MRILRACLYAVVVAMNCALTLPASAQIFLHYGFDDNYLDDSPNSNHGILEDLHSTPVSFLTGTQGTHYQFGTHSWNSPNASDKVAFTTSFMPADGAPWTVSFWYDMGPLGGGGGAGAPIFSDADGNNRVLFRDDPLNGAFGTVAGQSVEWEENLNMNRSWNHYAFVANGSGVDLDGVAGDDALVLYFNGSPIAPDAGFDLTNFMTDVVFDNIGDGVQNDSTSSEAFRGGIGVYDELWVFEEALTSDEVQALFQTNTPPDFSTDNPVVPEPSSIAIWSLMGLGLAGIGYFRLTRKR